MVGVQHSYSDKVGDDMVEEIDISLEDVEKMSHFGVIRDWTIELKDGRKIVLGADIIKVITEHENEETNAN